jgi:hypothetical protein
MNTMFGFFSLGLCASDFVVPAQPGRASDVSPMLKVFKKARRFISCLINTFTNQMVLDYASDSNILM